MEFVHEPVMLWESIEGLDIKPDGIYLDGTVGGGGHSCEIAKRLVGGRLIALDKDPDAIKAAESRLGKYKNATVVQSDFAYLDEVLDKLGIDEVDGILLDLGVSSYQIDNAERGFSYHNDGKLDMRMSKEGVSAYDIVNDFGSDKIEKILREYGEEKFSHRIAENICKRRKIKPIETTFELVDIIRESIPAAARKEGGNPAKRSFQAIRIAVNSELDSLSDGLDKGFERLKSGGRMAVITFHSLEDRMVKQKFAQKCKGCICPADFPVCVCGRVPEGKLVNRKAIEATEKEISENKRSKSAKLRIIEKI